MPTPPVPMTTTVSPGSVPADTVAEPQPVLTPHDTSGMERDRIVDLDDGPFR